MVPIEHDQFLTFRGIPNTPTSSCTHFSHDVYVHVYDYFSLCLALYIYICIWLCLPLPRSVYIYIYVCVYISLCTSLSIYLYPSIFISICVLADPRFNPYFLIHTFAYIWYMLRRYVRMVLIRDNSKSHQGKQRKCLAKLFPFEFFAQE